MGRQCNNRIILNFLGKDGNKFMYMSRKKWPEGKLSVINIYPKDSYLDEKFLPLSEADRFANIYLVGHHYPGEEGLFDDTGSHCFTFNSIAKILCQHITSPEVCILENADSYIDSTQLSIHVIACHSGKRLGFFKKEASLAEKLFMAILYDPNNPLSVEIHASKMFVIPVPCSEGEFKNSYKEMKDQPSFGKDWHERYVDSPYWRGQLSFRSGYAFYSILRPSATPPGNYKQIIKRSTASDSGYRILSLKEYQAKEELILKEPKSSTGRSYLV